MKTTLKRAVLLIGCGVIVLASVVYAQESVSELEGGKPYTPSRLEWLAVELQAYYRVDPKLDLGFSIDFFPSENEDAILIYVIYFPNVNRQLMNMSINSARKRISMIVKSRGWSSWLKVKEQVEMAK